MVTTHRLLRRGKAIRSARLFRNSHSGAHAAPGAERIDNPQNSEQRSTDVPPAELSSEPRSAGQSDGAETPPDADESPTTTGGKDDDAVDRPGPITARTSGVRFALIVGLLVTAAMTAVGGWFGWQTYQAHQRTATRELLVATARQGAVNLTSIDYSKADADVKRILDSATGKFYDEFSQRSKAFVDVVRQAQSKSEGKVTAAGIESSGANDARVLVAVTVTTSNVAAQQQPTRNWRMRIDVQKTGSGAKVSNVEFVP
ncbi:hypothetical protein [Mycobacterium palustre]|uniref:hypothetical protein n=1 Tax=Mycobacterium palustre TaxID=153971 RepID=UPI001151FD0F|nr:hypothetical protein [Mycobacterium palustre]MCV7100430.1 hypothetical protein [Mycobacterium palustre]